MNRLGSFLHAHLHGGQGCKPRSGHSPWRFWASRTRVSALTACRSLFSGNRSGPLCLWYSGRGDMDLRTLSIANNITPFSRGGQLAANSSLFGGLIGEREHSVPSWRGRRDSLDVLFEDDCLLSKRSVKRMTLWCVYVSPIRLSITRRNQYQQQRTNANRIIICNGEDSIRLVTCSHYRV